MNIIDIFCLHIFLWICSYCFYCIRWELIYVLSIVVCIPSTFCSTLGHHQGRIYYKSDVTFVFAYYYYVRVSLPLKSIAFAFKWVSINSVSSLRHLSTLSLVWKLILLSVGCMFLICSASRISSFCLLFWCSNIVVLSVRIFRSCAVGHECFLNAELLNLYQKGALSIMFNEICIYIYIYIYIYIWSWRLEFKSWTREIAFHIALIPLGKVWIQLFSLQLWVNIRADWVLQPWWGN